MYLFPGHVLLNKVYEGRGACLLAHPCHDSRLFGYLELVLALAALPFSDQDKTLLRHSIATSKLGIPECLLKAE